MILEALEKYARNVVGDEVWRGMLSESGLDEEHSPGPGRGFDDQIEAIVEALARRTFRSQREIYKELGASMAPGLLGKNRDLIDPGWRTIDILEHTRQSAYEMTYDEVDPGRPTLFKIHRQSLDEIILIFSTPRFRTCGLVDGIVHGIAERFSEKIDITHVSCMQGGDPSCELIIRKIL